MEIGINGIEATNERFQQILASMGEKLMGEIGEFLKLRIKERTAAGKDVNGSAFAPYSAKYAFFRQKWGRPTNKVDLNFFGGMMGAMTQEVTADQVRVFFMPTVTGSVVKSNTTNAAKAYYLQQKREFFSMSPEDQKEIGTLVLDSLSEAMR